MSMPQPEHPQHLQRSPPRRRRLPIILVSASGLLLAGVIVALLLLRGAVFAPTRGPMAPPTVAVADLRPAPAPRPLNGTTRATAEVRVGEPVIVRTHGPGTHFGVFFEDDGRTGYFYGMDMRLLESGGTPIVDALHIYDGDDFPPAQRAVDLAIVWSNDGARSALLLNGKVHAVLDFQGRRAYCRTGFPEADWSWTDHPHDGDDAAVDLFTSEP